MAMLNEIKLLEQKLDNSKQYSEKINVLCLTWLRIKEHLKKKEDSNHLENISSLIRNSICMILQAEWKTLNRAMKTHFIFQISGCAELFKTRKELMIASQCQSIITLSKNDPWGDPTLINIMKEQPFEDTAALRFLEEDRHILKTRLNMLCGKKALLRVAQRVAAMVWKLFKDDHNCLSFLQREELRYILDSYLVLLMKDNNSNEIIALMRTLPFNYGLQFIRRMKDYEDTPPDNCKMWKFSRKAVEIVVMVFVSRAMIEESGGLLNDFLMEWLDIFSIDDADFPSMIDTLAAECSSSQNLFALSKALEIKVAGKHRLKCIELYIRGLNRDLNEMGHMQRPENEAELRAAEQHLSTGFLQLSNLLASNLKECRECILTAFYLNPSAESLSLVQDIAFRSGKCKAELLDTGQVLNSVPSEDQLKEVVKEEEEVPAGPNNDALQLPQALQDDLYAVVHFPRKGVLNWELDWLDLKKKCEECVEETSKGVRLAVKELKYLELDYSKFQHLPSAEDENHDGIEKGYELDNQSYSADDDTDEAMYAHDFSTSLSEASSDASFTMRKKSKHSVSIDPRRRKSKILKTPKRICHSSEDFKIRNDSMIGKKSKCPKKPKGKTPKSDSKRNGKSSVIQLQVSSGKDPRNIPESDITNSQSNYSALSLPEDVRKMFHKSPRDPSHLESLRKYRKVPGKISKDSHFEFSNIRSVKKKSHPLNDLTSFEMMVPALQCTTVQVAQVPGNVPPRNSSSTITKPDDGLSAQGTSSDQVNGKPSNNAQGGSSMSASSHQQVISQPSLNLVTPKLVETQNANHRISGVSAAGRTALMAASGPAPALSQLSSAPALTVIRRDAPQLVRQSAETIQNWPQRSSLGLTLLSSTQPKEAEERSSTTALPQFSQAFGFGRQDSTSSLKQALLGESKPNHPLKKLDSTAAGFGSQTQPAGFGAPAHPPGFGTQQVPPLQQCLPTTLQPSSLPLQQEQQQPQQSKPAQPPGLVTVHSTPTVGTATQTGTPIPTTISTAQVIVKTSGTATIVSPVATTPTGLLLAPGLTPVGTSNSGNLLTAAVCITTTNSALVSSTGHRSIFMVTSTKGTTVAAQAVGLPTRPPLPALVQRTYSSPSFGKSRLPQASVQTVTTSTSQSDGERSPPGSGLQGSLTPVVSVVASSSNQPELTSLVQTSNPPGSSSISSNPSALSVCSVKRNRSRVSNPILGKYLKESQAKSFDNAVDVTATTSTSVVVTTGTQTPGTPTTTTSTQGSPTPGATAAASAPSNVSRPLFSSTYSDDTLKAQLLEFESVLHHVHTTRQLKERQSLTEDEIQPNTPRPVQADASVQAGPQTVSQQREHTTAQATTQTAASATPQTTVKAVAPSTVSVSTSCTQTVSPSSSSSPNTPKKKSKVTKNLPVPQPVNVPLVQENRSTVFKPGILHTISATKHINQKITEDEETTARILSILRQYDEQLRCSPEINNKPAPRRRNQAQPGSSPNSKRKQKKSKSSISELSPGTDDTHTMGSEDSSIASHFADGVMEATPTSPLSTCDDRSIASTATTSGETTSGQGPLTSVNSFAGVTKSAPLLSDALETPSLRTSNNAPKVLPTVKVLAPQKAQVLPKVQVAPKSQLGTKVLAIPKVPNIVKPPVRVQTPQTLPKGQTFPKSRLQFKVQTSSKVQQVNPPVIMSTVKTMSVSTSTTSQVSSVQSLKDLQVPSELPKESQVSNVSQVSRVIQSVETIKSSTNQELNPSLPLVQSQTCGQEEATEGVTASSPVSHLVRALQSSKQASQTPLLAKALETPAVPLPTSFAGILKAPSKLTISQPTSSIHVKQSPSKQKLQCVQLTAELPSLRENQSMLLVSPSAPTCQEPSQPTVNTSPSSVALQSSLVDDSLASPGSQAQKLYGAACVNQETKSKECSPAATIQEVPQPGFLVEQQELKEQATSPIVDSIDQLKVQPSVTDILQSDSKLLGTHSSLELTNAQLASSSFLTQESSSISPTGQNTSHLAQLPSHLVGQQTVESSSSPLGDSQIGQVGHPDQKQDEQTQASPQVALSPNASHSQSSSSAQILHTESQPQLTSQSAQSLLQVQSTSTILEPSSQNQTPVQSTSQVTLQAPQTTLIMSSSENPLVTQSLQSHGQLPQMLEPANQSQIAIPSTKTTQGHTSRIAQSAPLISTSQVVSATTRIQAQQIGLTAAKVASTQVMPIATQAQLSQIIHSSPQLVQSVSTTSLPQLVHNAKSPLTQQQRFGMRFSTPHLIQISPPQLLQPVSNQQLQSSQQILVPQAPQVPVAYSVQKQPDNEAPKIVSPTKQNLVPVYMVPSSSASQLPVMVSPGSGVVHVGTLVNSQTGNVQVPVVVHQVSKSPDGKLSRDPSQDHFVISCDSSQPLILSTIQQLLGGSAPVVSAGHICTALTTPTTATAVTSSAPLVSVSSAVDSATAIDSSIFSQDSEIVSTDKTVVAISSSTPGCQTYSTLSATTQSSVLEAPTAPQVLPRAATPSSASGVSPLTNTSPSSAPTRPTTLLALQKQQQIQQLAQLQQLRLKERQQQEEKEKQREMQTIQHLRRLTQQQQQASQADSSQHSQVQVTQDSENASAQSETYPQPALLLPQQQSTPQQIISQVQVESQGVQALKVPQSQTPQLLRQPITIRKARDDVPPTVLSQVIISKGGRASSVVQAPVYKKTEPTQLKQLLEHPPVPLPPLSASVVRRSSLTAAISPASAALSTSPLMLPAYCETLKSHLRNDTSKDKTSAASLEKENNSKKSEQICPTPGLKQSVTSTHESLQSINLVDKQTVTACVYKSEKVQSATLLPKQSTDPVNQKQLGSDAVSPAVLDPPSEKPTLLERSPVLKGTAVSPAKLSQESTVAPLIASQEMLPAAPLPKSFANNLPSASCEKESSQTSSELQLCSLKCTPEKQAVSIIPESPKQSSQNLKKSSSVSVHATAISVRPLSQGCSLTLSSPKTLKYVASASKKQEISQNSNLSSSSNEKELLPACSKTNLEETDLKKPSNVKEDTILAKLHDETGPKIPAKISTKNSQSNQVSSLESKTSTASKVESVEQFSPASEGKTPVAAPAEMHLSLHPDRKPPKSSELRVYPPSHGIADCEKTPNLSSVKSPTCMSVLSAGSPLLTSLQITKSPPKAQNSRQALPLPNESSVSKIQTSTQGYAPPLTQTTEPLDVSKPSPEKAHVTFQSQTLLCAGTSGQVIQPTAIPIIETVQHHVCTSVSSQKSISCKILSRPKRQRNRRLNQSLSQTEENSSSQTSDTAEADSSSPCASVPETVCATKHSDSEPSPSKRSKKKKDIGNPALVSQHMSDTIMRVSLGEDDSEPIEDAKKEYFEDQENIPVEVAFAEICGEDIDVAKNLIEGNLQGDIKAIGAITLLPADPLDNSEELNFSSFRNVVRRAKDDSAKSEEESSASLIPLAKPIKESCVIARTHTTAKNLLDQSDSKEELNHIIVKTDVTELSSIESSPVKVGVKNDLSLLSEGKFPEIKQELSPVFENKEEDVTSTRISQKRKTFSQTGSCSEHSRSLSGSEDLSMDKTSTSDIFPPETDFLLETTLSPSFLGEIAQMSPSNSQDVISASPEPPDKKKRCFSLKSGSSTKNPYESMPKEEEALKEEGKVVLTYDTSSQSISSKDIVNQFNGAVVKVIDNGDSSSDLPAVKSECDLSEASCIEPSVSDISGAFEPSFPACQESISEPTIPCQSQPFSSLPDPGSVLPGFSSGKSTCEPADSNLVTFDEAESWEKEPLYALPSSESEDEFWRESLASGTQVGINQEEEDTNSSSTPSDVFKNLKQTARVSPRLSSTVQSKRCGVKRKDDSIPSLGKKQCGEKKKRMSSVEDDDGLPKYGSVLRSYASKTSNPVRRESRVDLTPKEDTNSSSMPRRVSSRTHKRVTKFDEPQKKVKSKTVPLKKK